MSRTNKEAITINITKLSTSGARRQSSLFVFMALLPPALIPTVVQAQAAAPNHRTAGDKPVTRITALHNKPAARPFSARGQEAPIVAGANDLGPENEMLARRAGVWDVAETVWATPDGPPTTNKLVAERRMIGAFLQEIIRPALGSEQVLRMDYLSFHRGEGRWKYVSMDMRAPVGIMSAASFGTGEKGRIDVRFEPLTVPGTGQLLQMNQVMTLEDANHDRKDQRFVIADGKGTATKHLYVYTRRP